MNWTIVFRMENGVHSGTMKIKLLLKKLKVETFQKVSYTMSLTALNCLIPIYLFHKKNQPCLLLLGLSDYHTFKKFVLCLFIEPTCLLEFYMIFYEALPICWVLLFIRQVRAIELKTVLKKTGKSLPKTFILLYI